jgi:hypothetical protein
MHKQFDLDVVWIAKDDEGSELSLFDPRVHNTLRLEMRHPSLQFVSIGDLEREVVKADAPFVEFTAQRYVMRLDRYRCTGWVDQVPVLEALATAAVNLREAHDVVPPDGRSIAIRDRQFNVRDSLQLRHGISLPSQGLSPQHCGQIDRTCRAEPPLPIPEIGPIRQPCLANQLTRPRASSVDDWKGSRDYKRTQMAEVGIERCSASLLV